MIQFDEKHPEFKGFTEFYNRELLPKLIEKEFHRKKAVGQIRRYSVALAVIVLAVAAFFVIRTGKPFIGIFGLFFGLVGYFGLRQHFLKDIKNQTKNHLAAGICRFIGWTFSEQVIQPPNLTPMIDNGLLPKRYDRVTFEDEMRGEAHDADFVAVECHMEREDRDSDGDTRWVTVLRGSLMALDFHREFLGRTVVLRDKGFFNRKKKSGMKRVGLADPKFEKIFEAYGTDQVEARYLLTPTFMQRLVDLEDSVDGKKIRFAFLGGMLLIAVETPNRFEAGSMRVSLTDPKRTQDILDEVSAVYNVVDGVMKPQSRPSFNA